jgi:hypothetical protein
MARAGGGRGVRGGGPAMVWMLSEPGRFGFARFSLGSGHIDLATASSPSAHSVCWG